MKKKYTSLLSILFVSAILSWVYFTIMPQWLPTDEPLLSEFSSKRALEHIKIISEKPHYIGSENHKNVAAYIEKELQKIGLETKTEEGTTLSDWGNLVKSKNILARIKGSNNSKALLLLSHYDSASHSYSHGAGDDATGIATILESIRAFIHNKTPHKNDIIILFSDAEELGLNGAALFVTQSKWAKDVGLAVNFEARGTSGPAYMFMEVNGGNSKMIKEFSAANPKYPASNSLMYSIYKMLPNDTDLTVFREQGKIQGFNFAFIDDHFNYHTAQDDLAHLSGKTVEHQGSYLMPVLKYFSNSDLSNLNSDEDYIYFNTPFYFVIYPFSWIFPMLIVSCLLFLFFIFVGIGKRTLAAAEIGKGFIPLFGSLIVSGSVAFFGWKLLLEIYPQYKDIQQGFTYNGHYYIAAFVFLSLGISFLFYMRSRTENLVQNHAVAPVILWILLNFGIACYLPGAGFFIIPVLCSILMLGWFVVTQKINPVFNLIFSIPALVIYVPYIIMFPIGLGLKILSGSAILTVLVFSLLLPIFGLFSKKGIWAGLFFAGAIACFVCAHLRSDYAPGKAKPNSLDYIYDADKDKAYWASYDKSLDEWTKIYLADNSANPAFLNVDPLFSKYNSEFTFAATALVRELEEPRIDFVKDSIVGKYRFVKIRITPNRKVNRYDIFANENMVFHNMKANGAEPLGQKGSLYLRKNRKIISYYIVDNEPLELQFMISAKTPLDMELMESSFDLMSNPAYSMEKRKSWMMPMPFVLTDAVVVKKKIAPTAKQVIPVVVQKTFSLQNTATNDTIPDPEAEN